MVDFIKTWGTALICAAMIGAICNVLLPHHSIAKVARALVGIYLAVVIVSPFINGNIGMPDSIEEFTVDNSYGTEAYDDAVLRQTEAQIEQEIIMRLETEDVTCGAVEVSVNIDETSGIYCDEVKLTLGAEFREKEYSISEIVAGMCGIEPVFVYSETTE